ncbi:MAG: SDR family NAD(P)-dependent oxidoreductase [Pseudomonadales bacterium]|nr:SDR family NAD(P)-dependent oxidoreductase [Pseudomonadales bacterium]
MSKNKSGPNAIATSNSVLSAVTTALFDLFSSKGQLQATSDNERIDGKTCLVTGSNSGLGKAVAIDLAKRGGHVIMACRSGIPEAGEDVKRLSGSDKVEMIQVDLSDLEAVNGFCDTLKARNITLDITVMNAGLMPLNSRRSPQGYELMFAVHFLANRVMLNRMLNDNIITATTNDASPARIIFVSSETHQSSEAIDFEHFGDYVEYGLKEGLKHYGTSKLHLSTFVNELSRRLNPDYVEGNGKVNVAVHSLCPGPIASNIARESPAFLRPILVSVMKLFFNSPAIAALPVILLACSKTMSDRTGVYLHMMKEKPCSAHALDIDSGKKLWLKSKELLGAFLINSENLDKSIPDYP